MIEKTEEPKPEIVEKEKYEEEKILDAVEEKLEVAEDSKGKTEEKKDVADSDKKEISEISKSETTAQRRKRDVRIICGRL